MVETVNEANMRIGVCGHLGGGKEYLDGQTIKTKTIIEELQKIFFEDELIIVDTYGGLKHMFKHIVRLIIMIFKCDNVIILPAQNGLRVFAPIMNILNFRHRCSMHYIVIGGWLPVFLEGKPLLTKCLKRFDAVYVETKTMMHSMKEKGFRNIVLMKNFKKNTVLSVSDIKCKIDKPFELCMFSRVTPKKGIEDAINAIVEINDGFNDNVYSLTIYGQVDDSYNKKFTDYIVEQLKRIKIININSIDMEIPDDCYQIVDKDGNECLNSDLENSKQFAFDPKTGQFVTNLVSFDQESKSI